MRLSACSGSSRVGLTPGTPATRKIIFGLKQSLLAWRLPARRPRQRAASIRTSPQRKQASLTHWRRRWPNDTPWDPPQQEHGGMAKQPATDAIMAADKLKPMLALSKREPVNAAIGMTADGDGFILLDKKAKPKTVVSMLKSTAAKAKLQLNPSSIRYGRAEVDTDYDAGMVRFFINKEAPGVLRVK